eukprot:6461835-Amphidinium_carterae.1
MCLHIYRICDCISPLLKPLEHLLEPCRHPSSLIGEHSQGHHMSCVLRDCPSLDHATPKFRTLIVDEVNEHGCNVSIAPASLAAPT